jgi:glycosyltransferase involved in cell wall biosynthesis
VSNNKANIIIVNARFLTQPITGVQRFAIELCLCLIKFIPNIKFVSPKNILQTELAKQLEVHSFGMFTSHLWEQFELPIYLKQIHNPILLNLCNTAPLYYKKNIVCIHDIAFEVNPKWFSFAFVKLYQFLVPRIARQSLQIITVSNFSKISIMEYTGVPEEKIIVIYNGITSIFQKCKNQEEEKPVFSGNFILAVSSIDPRKNLVSLVRAFKRINNYNLKLIIVGSESKIFADTQLKFEITDCPNIIFTGYLSDKALSNLYKKAHIFVYPSLYEGFGIPPLEAMASGCPTIVSETSALPEICGDASLYINPLDIDDISTKIKLLAIDEALRQKLINKGYKQIEKYNWEKSADKIAALLKQYL